MSWTRTRAALFYLGSAALLTAGCAGPPAPVEAAAPADPAAESPPITWTTAHNAALGASFAVPSNAQLHDASTGFGDQQQLSICFRQADEVCITFGQDALPFQGFVRAEVAIRPVPGLDTEAACLSEESNLHRVGERDIGGVPFAQYSDHDGHAWIVGTGAGYAAFVGGTCLWIRTMVVIAHVPDPTIPDHRLAALHAELDHIVDSVVLDGNRWKNAGVAE